MTASQSRSRGATSGSSAAADNGDGKGKEDTDSITEFLEYVPAGMRNGSIIAHLSNVPGVNQYNKSSQGKISGLRVVMLQVENDSHPLTFERNLHAKIKHGSGGLILVRESAIIAVSDTAFMMPFEDLAPRAATCLRLRFIAEFSRDNDPQCSRLQEYFYRRMLLDVSADSCTAAARSGPLN